MNNTTPINDTQSDFEKEISDIAERIGLKIINQSEASKAEHYAAEGARDFWRRFHLPKLKEANQRIEILEEYRRIADEESKLSKRNLEDVIIFSKENDELKEKIEKNKIVLKALQDKYNDFELKTKEHENRLVEINFQQSAEINKLKEALGFSNPWPIQNVLMKLSEATEILLHKKDYDGHSHEEMLTCIKRAKEIAEALGQINGL